MVYLKTAQQNVHRLLIRHRRCLIANSAIVYTTVESGNYYSCGITDDGVVDCWGVPTQDGEISPPSFDNAVVNLSVGPYHACAVDSQGIAKCWGQNVHGQTEPPLPADNFVDVHAFGIFNSCGVKRNGEVLCWGRDGLNVIPNNLDTVFPSRITEFKTNGDTSCATRADGTVSCWQFKAQNQTIANFSNGPYKKVVTANDNRYAACALTFNGEVECVQPAVSANGAITTPILQTIERLPNTYQDIANNSGDLYGWTLDNGLVGIDAGVGSRVSRLLDIVNGTLDMPELTLNDAVYYGAGSGTELFFDIQGSIFNFILEYDIQIIRNNEVIATTDSQRSYMDRTTSPDQQYTYEIRSVHSFGQVGPSSGSIEVSTGAAEPSNPGESPTAPVESGRPDKTTGLRAEVYSQDIELFWDRNFSGNVLKYEIRKNGELVASSRGTSWYDNTTKAGEAYQFDVVAIGHDNQILGIDSTRVQVGPAECR